MFTPSLSRIFSCFPAKPSSSSSPAPPPVKDPVKDKASLFEIITTHSTFLADSCDEFIRTPKGSEKAVQAGNKIDLVLRHTDPKIETLVCIMLDAIGGNRPWLYKKLQSHPKIKHRAESIPPATR